MKKIRFVSALVAISLVAGAVAWQDEAKIVWQPKAGSVAVYNMNVNAEGDFGQGPMKIEVSMKVTNKIDTVTEKEVTVSSKTTDMKIKLDGNEMPGGGEEETGSSTFSLDGELISTKSDSGMGNIRLEQMSTFLYPDRAVKPGETWTRTVKGDKGGKVNATATYTYQGTEKVGNWDCFKVTYDYKETQGEKPSTAKGTIWIDQATGDAVKLEATLKDVVFQDGLPPMNATIKMMRAS